MSPQIQLPQQAQIKNKKKYAKVIGCPEGCRRKFISAKALNIHLNRVHNSEYKIEIDSQSCAYYVPKL